MEEQTLAELLYDSAFSVKKQRKGRSEEQKTWASFLELLNQELDASGCGAKAETYTESEPYRQACGYHRDYGYFMVSCGDRGSSSITILEEEAEAAKNRFLALIIEKKAYESGSTTAGTTTADCGSERLWSGWRRLWTGRFLHSAPSGTSNC